MDEPVPPSVEEIKRPALGDVRLPADYTTKLVGKIQRDHVQGIARAREISEGIKEAGRRKAERDAEIHSATVETPDKLRRLTARVDDLARGHERTHRWVVATTILTAVVVVLTIALLVIAE